MRAPIWRIVGEHRAEKVFADPAETGHGAQKRGAEIQRANLRVEKTAEGISYATRVFWL